MSRQPSKATAKTPRRQGGLLIPLPFGERVGRGAEVAGIQPSPCPLPGREGVLRASAPWRLGGKSSLRACVPPCLRACHGRPGGRPLRAFTLVEVLIVIVIISLLIAVIGLVGVKVIHGQKVALTEMTMRNVKIAIDRFAELDPLKNIYDRKDHVTFGPYPPYTLAGDDNGLPVDSVREAVELGVFADLEQRLRRDLSGSFAATPDGYVDIEENNRNDDIRALYTYLAVYAHDTLSTIPDSAKKALPDRPPGDPSEKVNPAGTGTNPPPLDGSAIDVLGIYDAWGVPLDYFLYVKLEWDGIDNLWRVTQRIPVLHSWGITAEEYKVEAGGADALDPELWIFSDPFPSPAAAAVAWDTGTLGPGSPANAGWARALGAGDLRIVPGDRNNSFGYVP